MKLGLWILVAGVVLVAAAFAFDNGFVSVERPDGARVTCQGEVNVRLAGVVSPQFGEYSCVVQECSLLNFGSGELAFAGRSGEVKMIQGSQVVAARSWSAPLVGDADFSIRSPCLEGVDVVTLQLTDAQGMLSDTKAVRLQ